MDHGNLRLHGYGELANVAIDRARGRLPKVEKCVREPLLMIIGSNFGLQSDDWGQSEALPMLLRYELFARVGLLPTEVMP